MQSLRIQNIVKKFGTFVALQDINLTVEAGQFLILVGPSGCGKSTLLNMIAGLESVTAGKIFIGDKDVTELPPKDRDIAMVFQSYALYPNMTIRKNISFGLEMRKIPKPEQEKIVDKVAKMLQIEQLLDRKPTQLSGGQRQRVAMGRALARDPDLFLFDEPLSNLDAKLRVEMRAEIKELHQRTQTTIVYVTHDQIEAMTLGDIIAVMKEGEILQFGTPKEIYNNPVNQFIAGFMGSPSMNFIPCKVVEIGIENEKQLALEIEANGKHSLLPCENLSKGLNAYLNKQVIMGLRPEQITDVRANQTSNDPKIDCVISFIEPIGSDTLITTRLNKVKVIGRIHPDTECQIGDPLQLKFDLSKIVFFDPKTQERIY